jgi:hypothetical protein
MSFKFDDIMQKFYSDPALGIQTEDAPVNNASSGAVSMPPDAKMKKKKKLYDGRTKDAKAFVKRMETLRARRESKLAKKVQENTINREQEYLMVEDNMDMLKNIVKNKSAKNIKFKDGNMKVDMFTASAITQVFDQVNSSNQQKMAKLINGKKAEFMKIADFALSKVK